MEDLSKPESIRYTEIAAEIKAMADRDQEMREKAVDDKESWDDRIDPDNTARMKEIIEQIGWPTVSKVGSKASTDAWILVQHADKDIVFQKYCLDLMKQEPTGEVALHDIAYLEDRIRIHSGKPQLYGTQFNWTPDNKPLQDIEDPENVDQRRAEMGLKTLAENIEEMYRKYKMNKPE